MNKKRNKVVRESDKIYLSEYGEKYSKGLTTLERIFGRERTLERMIKNRENKKDKLDDEISDLKRELDDRKRQIKELSKYLNPSISVVSPKKTDKYKRWRGKVYLSFGNKKSRYVWFNLGTDEMLKGKSRDELREMTRRLFLRKMGQ